MRVFTPKIAEQVINRGWHISTHEYRDHEGNIKVTQDVELDYDYCVPEAMQMLVNWKQQFQSFQVNFKSIDADVARSLSRICCDYMYLSNLEALDSSNAKRLVNSSDYILNLEMQVEPGPAAIQGLIKPMHERPLNVTLPKLSIESARILASYSHELYLELPFHALTPTVTAILSGHIGYRLNLRLTEFDGIKAHASEVLEILSRTPCKRAVCVYLDENVVRFETEERDWGRWERRIDRMSKLAAEQ